MPKYLKQRRAGWYVFVYRCLDWLFRPKQKPHGKRHVIRDGDGQFQVVREVEQEQLPDKLPGNVTRLHP